MLLLPAKVWRSVRFFAEPTAGQPKLTRAKRIQPTPGVDESKLPAAGTSFGGKYDGVILWPKEEKNVTTLVPPMPALRPNLFAKNERQPFIIPFFGVYWLFKPPDFRPPANSLTAHGRPLELTFRSTDFRPLVMEAHQPLGRRIELACCGQIHVAISNGDTIANSLEMEVRLSDLTANGAPSLSLGRQPLAAMPLEGESSSETLSYPIPPQAPITHFDEIAIEFHLHPRRSSRSPKIAVERFLFFPRN